MKNAILLLLVFTFILPLNAQEFQDWGRKEKMRDKLEQLEKVRLLEILDLDETTAVKFITRQKDHRERMHAIMQKRKSIMEGLIEKIKNPKVDDDFYKNGINAIINIEKDLGSERKKYIDSLWEILNAKQIATVITFEEQFRADLIDMLRERRELKENKP